MSDLSNLYINQRNYCSLNCEGLQAGSIYMPNAMVIAPGTTANPQPINLSALALQQPDGAHHQLYMSQGAYFSISSLASQTLNVGNNTVLFTNPTNQLNMNCSFSAGVLTLPITGVYKVSFSLSYTPIGTNADNTLIANISYNGASYGTVALSQTNNEALIVSSSVLIRCAVASAPLSVVISSARTGGSEALSGNNLVAELISSY